jgi:hypothetical protein
MQPEPAFSVKPQHARSIVLDAIPRHRVEGAPQQRSVVSHELLRVRTGLIADGVARANALRYDLATSHVDQPQRTIIANAVVSGSERHDSPCGGANVEDQIGPPSAARSAGALLVVSKAPRSTTWSANRLASGPSKVALIRIAGSSSGVVR